MLRLHGQDTNATSQSPRETASLEKTEHGRVMPLSDPRSSRRIGVVGSLARVWTFHDLCSGLSRPCATVRSIISCVLSNIGGAKNESRNVSFCSLHVRARRS